MHQEPQESAKPEMSRHEASWHEHMAGMRAAEEARRRSADPRAVTAMASATAGPVTIAGYVLHPAAQGTLWTLQRLAREFREWADGIGMPVAGAGEPDGTRELLEMGLTLLSFCDSLRIWHTLDRGGLAELIMEAEHIIHGVAADDYKLLEAHFQREMQRIRELTPEPAAAPQEKKNQVMPGGDSHGTPSLPTATPSLTSNG